jgi:hypothetical protein
MMLATAIETDPAEALVIAECIAIVRNDARRRGMSEAVELHLVAKAKRAVEVLQGQGLSPRVLAAALRVETRLSPEGHRLCSPREWAWLAAEFEAVAQPENGRYQVAGSRRTQEGGI